MNDRFKGGPVLLHSGGTGPDDWLIKPIAGGRWTLVLFRWGRNWTGREVGKDEANRLAEADREAMIAMYHAGISRVCVGDLAQRLARMHRRGPVPTVGAAEFWQKHN